MTREEFEEEVKITKDKELWKAQTHNEDDWGVTPNEALENLWVRMIDKI